MATTEEYINYVCSQVCSQTRGDYEIRYKKMFGEYIVYVNNKPILLVCHNNVFVKKIECIESLMKDAESGFPYKGSKEHYILDIDDLDLCNEVVKKLEEVTALPKPKKK